MDNLFFWISKLGWMAVSPDNLLVILAVVAFLCLVSGRKKTAGGILGFVVTAMVCISFLPLGQKLILPLETRFQASPRLPDQVDGIIMLGGAENGYLASFTGQAEIKDGADRYLGFLRLIREYPDAKAVFTGGSGSVAHQEVKDADVARLVFADLGIEPGRILIESDARNTYENGLRVKDLVDYRPGQTWVLVTTAMHMPRAYGVFARLGVNVIPWPVDYQAHPDMPYELGMNFVGNLRHLQRACREWLGLFVYYITGKTAVLLPGTA